MENDQKREWNKDMKNCHNSSKTIMLLFIKYSSALPRTGAYNLNFPTLLLIFTNILFSRTLLQSGDPD